MIRSMRDLEKPVIASVNGVAAGAGMSLALAADFRIAGESARFIQAFVRIGLVPDAGSSYFLPRLVGTAKALELAMLGDTIDSAEALRLGLVTKSCRTATCRHATAEMAARLSKGPRSMGLIKQLFLQSLDSTLDEQLAARGGRAGARRGQRRLPRRRRGVHHQARPRVHRALRAARRA